MCLIISCSFCLQCFQEMQLQPSASLEIAHARCHQGGKTLHETFLKIQIDLWNPLGLHFCPILHTCDFVNLKNPPNGLLAFATLLVTAFHRYIVTVHTTTDGGTLASEAVQIQNSFSTENHWKRYRYSNLECSDNQPHQFEHYVIKREICLTLYINLCKMHAESFNLESHAVSGKPSAIMHGASSFCTLCALHLFRNLFLSFLFFKEKAV